MNNPTRSTESLQNTISRLISEIELDVINPSIELKKQHYKVYRLLGDLELELDILNDMKE